MSFSARARATDFASFDDQKKGRVSTEFLLAGLFLRTKKIIY